MNADTLLENFEILADAPRGVDRLRDLILGLAVNGLISNSDTSTWRVTTLGDEVQIVRGITFPSSAKGRSPGRGLLPCLRTANIQNEIDWEDLLYVSAEYVRNDDQHVQINDVLISMANSRELVGKVALVRRSDISCTLGGFIAAIRCGVGIDPKYLMAILRVPSAREKLIDSSTQTTNIANISLGRLRPFVLSLPPLSEQQVIVAKVDELMTLCDQLEQQQKLRDNLRTATRKSSIDAISTAATPDELDTAWKRISRNWEAIADTTESVSSLRSLILDLAVRGQISNGRVQKFDAISGLPVGWKIQRLDQVCKYLQRGKGPKYSDMSSCVVVSQKCVQWTGFDISKARFVDEQSLSSYGEERFLRNGDILWNSTGTGTVGRTAIYMSSELYGKVVADSHVTVLRAPDMNSRYLWFWTASAGVQSMISSLTSGTTNQQELNLSAIKSLLVPVPPQKTQNEIVTKVDELMALCDQLEVELITRCELAEKFARSVVDVS